MQFNPSAPSLKGEWTVWRLETQHGGGGALGMTFLYRVVNARKPPPPVFKSERMSRKCVFSRVSHKFWSQVDIRNELAGGNEESVLVENFHSEA